MFKKLALDVRQRIGLNTKSYSSYKIGGKSSTSILNPNHRIYGNIRQVQFQIFGYLKRRIYWVDRLFLPILLKLLTSTIKGYICLSLPLVNTGEILFLIPFHSGLRARKRLL